MVQVGRARISMCEVKAFLLSGLGEIANSLCVAVSVWIAGRIQGAETLRIEADSALHSALVSFSR
jgi:hypothetical protein